ncbi:MAG: FMN-binding glutamate synthase family protein [Desulfuromonadales bacterium]|nr:FMN-binding glutamate synthase family protein [Desulfuromonadales bacterium]
MIEKWSRTFFFLLSLGGVVSLLALARVWPPAGWGLIPLVIFLAVGLRDVLQKKHTLLRNFPVLGHFRFLLESIRPEIRQYFVEGDSEENPFSREKRSVVYQRSKGTLDTLPFGTRRDVYQVGYQWINHSLGLPVENLELTRCAIGEKSCSQPYAAALLNISAMSYGALSRNAIMALNRAAQAGGFSHNTGEGGISDWHCQGGDLVWQIGTGYFGCRRADGTFCASTFEERAALPAVKMIEVKLSQGAKPGHGGILPAAKVSAEIARIRDVPIGQDVISPPVHSAFSTPGELLEFLARLRELAGGKPVGFKLCVGSKREFLAICKAMLESGLHPDFITVDGAEGGTGAAPLEFSNSVGMPLNDGLAFIHSALTGIGFRDRVRLIAAGKISTGFHLLEKIALGADLCNAARSMMFALGCIQALKCNTNECPTGIATQLPRLYRGLDVGDKAERVARFQKTTVAAAMELAQASGMSCTPRDLRWQIFRRTAPGEVRALGDLYPCLAEGELLQHTVPAEIASDWSAASAAAF